LECGWQEDIAIDNSVKLEMALNDREISVNDILFDKSFAKAIWGVQEICITCEGMEIEGGKSYVPGEPDEYYANCKKCGVSWMDKREFDVGNHLPAFQSLLYYLL